MTAILEKLKILGASLKKTTKSTAKTIARNTPEAADKAKKIISTVAEKTDVEFSHTKLRLKLHNLNKASEEKLSELGGLVFELLAQKKSTVYEDLNVKDIMGEIDQIKQEIKETELEIKELKVEKKEEESE